MSIDQDEQDDPRDAELGALQDLVQSAGWAVLARVAEEQYGLAAIGTRMLLADTRIEPSLARAEEVASEVAKLRGAHNAVMQLVAYPKQRIAELTAKPKKKGPFEHLRRGSR